MRQQQGGNGLSGQEKPIPAEPSSMMRVDRGNGGISWMKIGKGFSRMGYHAINPFSTSIVLIRAGVFLVFNL